MELITLSYAGVTALEYKQLVHSKGGIFTESLKSKLKVAERLNPATLNAEILSKGLDIVTILDDDYPALLKEIYDPPYVLYIKGDRALLKSDMFGIVGSRKATMYSKKSLERIIPGLKNYVIVSGLAYGADEMAHNVCIENGMDTIGVLAFGHNLHYPKSTLKTRSVIEKIGLVVSEYPPHSKIEKWKFVGRNRIISGLSRGVLVTEAESGSGSLITLDMAVSENKTAMCLPGNITSSLSIGTNESIREGAVMVTSYSDILSEIESEFLV